MSDDFDNIAKEAVENMRKQQEKIPILKSRIAMAQKAGIDVSEMTKTLRELEAKISKFVGAYGKL